MNDPAFSATAEPPPSRRFNLGDVMITVGTIAIAMSLSGRPKFDGMRNRAQFCGLIIGQLEGKWKMYGGSTPELYAVLARTANDELREDMLIVVISLTPAAILFRFNQPRPGWNEMLRQPGFLAPCAAVVAYALVRILEWFQLVPNRIMPLAVGVAVVMSWTPLLVTRCWKGQRGWVDRLGRAVGVGWMVLGCWSLLDLYIF